MRKEEPLPLATPWMDLEGVMLSEISQTERQVLQGIFYLWNRKKKKTKKKTSQKQSRNVSARGLRVEEEENRVWRERART